MTQFDKLGLGGRRGQYFAYPFDQASGPPEPARRHSDGAEPEAGTLQIEARRAYRESPG